MTMDELCARELLDRLASAELPPSRVDVGLVRRRGRRILFWRRVGAPGASALAVVAVAALISSNVISLGRTHTSAPGPVHPRTVFNPFVPYASFGWLPAGYTSIAGSIVSWWGSESDFTTKTARRGLGDTLPNTATAQSLQVSVGSAARHETITLTVNTANSCTFGTAPPLTGKMGQIAEKLRKEHPNLPAEPYQLMCHFDNTGGGGSVGEVIGKVNGSPAYGGGGLVWQYAKGSWAQLNLGVTGIASTKERRTLLTEWETNDSASVNAMLLRIADHIRYSEQTSESFAFRLTGMPRSARRYTTSYAQYDGRLLNTTLWLGPGWTTNQDTVQIAVTPASKPTACVFVQGRSRHVTLDGTRFTVRTMWTPPWDGDLDQPISQVLCGYVNGLQVNLAVAVKTPERGPSSITEATDQNVAVAMFRHLTLLGPDPAGWTTNPLG
jgi:hypothetical protein